MGDHGRFRLSNFVSVPVPVTVRTPARLLLPMDRLLDTCTRDVHQIGFDEFVQGDGLTRYRLGDTHFVFTVPEGVTVWRDEAHDEEARSRPRCPGCAERTWRLRADLGIGQGSISFLESGMEADRNIAISYLAAGTYPRNPHALADQLVGSVRYTPGWQRHPACDDE